MSARYRARRPGDQGSSDSRRPSRISATRVTSPESFQTLDLAMRRHIEAALERTRGRIEGRRGAAVLLGINPHTLRARMRKLGVAWDRYREE